MALIAFLTGAATAYTDLDDPAEPWRVARVGIDANVPEPFEKLRVDGNHISCWGRTYTVASPFPLQITSNGEKLLAGPMRLLVGHAGKQTSLAAQAVRIGLARDDRVEFTSSRTIEPFNIEIDGWLEYDGLMQIRLRVRSDRSAIIEKLMVEIPLMPDVAIFHHCGSHWGKHIYQRIGTEPDWKWGCDWQALTWVGDHYRGLTFVTERADWKGPADRSLQLERHRNAVIFRANLIAEPTRVSQPLTYTIGIQATPGKPLPLGWHGRHVTGPADINLTPQKAQRLRRGGLTVVEFWNSDTKHFSYPQPKDPEAFARAVKTYHDAGIRVVVYVTLSGTGIDSEVQKRNHEEWLMGSAGKPLFSDSSPSEGMTSTCPASSYADWLVWAVDRAMEDYDIDGIYIDNPGPYYCSNERHGCGGGRRYPYFATRDLHKRLWKVIHGRKPQEGLIWEHNTGTSNSLNLTFVDIYSDGEQFRVKSKGRPEQITRTFLDITASGRQWGAQACFLPSALNTKEEYTDWLLARTLPYGNVLFSIPSWMDYSRLAPAVRARLDFGLGQEQVEWYTPEALPAYLAVLPEDKLLVGAYQRADKSLLVTIANPTGTHLTARLNLRPVQAALQGAPAVTDALTGVACPPLGRHMVLTVPANSFRMVIIKRQIP